MFNSQFNLLKRDVINHKYNVQFIKSKRKWNLLKSKKDHFSTRIVEISSYQSPSPLFFQFILFIYRMVSYQSSQNYFYFHAKIRHVEQQIKIENEEETKKFPMKMHRYTNNLYT